MNGPEKSKAQLVEYKNQLRKSELAATEVYLTTINIFDFEPIEGAPDKVDLSNKPVYLQGLVKDFGTNPEDNETLKKTVKNNPDYDFIPYQIAIQDKSTRSFEDISQLVKIPVPNNEKVKIELEKNKETNSFIVTEEYLGDDDIIKAVTETIGQRDFLAIKGPDMNRADQYIYYVDYEKNEILNDNANDVASTNYKVKNNQIKKFAKLPENENIEDLKADKDNNLSLLTSDSNNYYIRTYDTKTKKLVGTSKISAKAAGPMAEGTLNLIDSKCGYIKIKDKAKDKLIFFNKDNGNYKKLMELEIKEEFDMTKPFAAKIQKDQVYLVQNFNKNKTIIGIYKTDGKKYSAEISFNLGSDMEIMKDIFEYPHDGKRELIYPCTIN